jgi:diaminopimelate epimerase
MKILLGVLLVACFLAGAIAALAIVVASVRAQTRAVVVWPNGRVDIDWRAVEHCQTDLCRVARAARCN